METIPAIPDEQAALLRAIVTEPAEDTPRLVYADWLDEHGDPTQAKFIRDSIALDVCGPEDDHRREIIAERLDRFAIAKGLGWLASLGVHRADPAFDRGFPESVQYESFELFKEDRAALFARVPIQELTILQIGGTNLTVDTLSELAVMPELARLRALRLSNGMWPISPTGWEAFVESPHLANLSVLSVNSAELTDSHAAIFAERAVLPGLEELTLGWNLLTPIGALAIVRSTRFPKLETLGLAGNHIVEDRTRGSPYRTLVEALLDRFDGVEALRFGS